MLVVGACVGVAFTLFAQSSIPPAHAGEPVDRPGLDRQSFHDSLDLVLDRHVDPVDVQKVMGRGLEHMVASLDPYSHYVSAEARTLARDRRRAGGEAGLVTARYTSPGAGARFEIVAVYPQSPAATVGLSVGDTLLAVRGESTALMLSNMQVQIALSGAPGEEIELSVDRGRGPEPAQLQLAKAEVDALVQGELRQVQGRTIGVVQIHNFRAGTGARVDRELAELGRRAGKGGLDGLIIDLCGNPGGEVDEAVLVADRFIAEGVLTRTRGRGGAILREETATRAGTDTGTPLVILQDGRSASAAELLAVALQDHGRATIVGAQSFGKGTVQEVIGLADGSLLTLTVARYFSPEDRSIDGLGVTPDVPVANLARDAHREAERTLLAMMGAGEP